MAFRLPMWFYVGHCWDSLTFFALPVELETTQAKIGQDYPRFTCRANGLRWGSFCNLWRLSIFPVMTDAFQKNTSCFILTVTFSVLTQQSQLFETLQQLGEAENPRDRTECEWNATSERVYELSTLNALSPLDSSSVFVFSPLPILGSLVGLCLRDRKPEIWKPTRFTVLSLSVTVREA